MKKNITVIGKRANDVVSFASSFLPDSPVVVEAGAFNGRDTATLSAAWPTGCIYAFEPVPEIFAQLKNRAADLCNVTCFEQALSSQVGTATLNIAERPKKAGVPTQAGSLLKPKERLEWSPMIYPKTITVPTTTLDIWADEQQIEKVDFLWLDLQGHELAVMQASPTIISKAQVIYTEVNFVEAYQGQPLYDEVQAWLEQQGFVLVAQDFTDTTSWFFGNMVFVNADLIE